jgi:hypothetical protein
MRKKLACFLIAAFAAAALSSSPVLAAKQVRSGSTIIASRDFLRD